VAFPSDRRISLEHAPWLLQDETKQRLLEMQFSGYFKFLPKGLFCLRLHGEDRVMDAACQ
jgi:hypothetical protein